MLDEMANKKLTYSQMHMELLTLKQKSHACFYHLEYEYLEEYRMEIRKKTFISDQTGLCIAYIQRHSLDW